jgi:hypothetical protein
MTFRRSVTTKLAVAACATISLLGLGASSAHAAAGWGPEYDLNGDGCSDIAFYSNSLGTVTQAYLKIGRGCRWDTLARDMDQDGTFEEIWFDTMSPGAGWDALLYGPNLFTNSGSYDMQVSDPYGGVWWIVKPVSATAGPPSYGTVGGQYAGILAMARLTGYAA